MIEKGLYFIFEICFWFCFHYLLINFQTFKNFFGLRYWVKAIFGDNQTLDENGTPHSNAGSNFVNI